MAIRDTYFRLGIDRSIYRVVNTRTFMGGEVLICDRIFANKTGGCVTIVRAGEVTHATYEPASAAEWAEAEAKAVAAMEAEAKRWAAIAEGERYGFKVHTRRGVRGEMMGETYIVRVTASHLVDHCGTRWGRHNGRRIGGGGAWPREYITSDSLAALADALLAAAAGERHDFIKAGKAAEKAGAK